PSLSPKNRGGKDRRRLARAREMRRNALFAARGMPERALVRRDAEKWSGGGAPAPLHKRHLNAEPPRMQASQVVERLGGYFLPRQAPASRGRTSWLITTSFSKSWRSSKAVST